MDSAVRIGHRSSGKTPARKRSIKWERLGGRWALCVVGLMLLFYIAPVRDYLRQRSDTAGEQAKVALLRREHDALVARVKALSQKSVIVLEARQMGMVRADERPFVVTP